MRAAAILGVAAFSSIAGCASRPVEPGLGALFHSLDTFADRRNMTAAVVERTFGTSLNRTRISTTLSFNAVEFGGVGIDSIELMEDGDTASLDIFPGGTCVSQGQVEDALGPPTGKSAIAEGGAELAYRQAAKSSGRWPAKTYLLSFEFLGASRCATQITVSHGPSLR